MGALKSAPVLWKRGASQQVESSLGEAAPPWSLGAAHVPAGWSVVVRPTCVRAGVAGAAHVRVGWSGWGKCAAVLLFSHLARHMCCHELWPNWSLGLIPSLLQIL